MGIAAYTVTLAAAKADSSAMVVHGRSRCLKVMRLLLLEGTTGVACLALLPCNDLVREHAKRERLEHGGREKTDKDSCMRGSILLMTVLILLEID